MTVTTQAPGDHLQAGWARLAAQGRWCWVSWTAIAVVYAAVLFHHRWNPSDVPQLVDAMYALLHGHLTSVYPSDTTLTSPPGFLLLIPLLVDVTGGNLLAQPSLVLVGVSSAVFLAFTARRLVSSLAPWRHPATDRLLIAGLLLGIPFTFGLTSTYHPQDLVAMGWVILAIDATIRHQSTRVGLTLGAAVLTRQWTLLAVVPLLLSTPAFAINLRRVVSVATALTVTMLTPFLVLDRAGLLHALAASVTAMGLYGVWDHLPVAESAAYSLARIAPLATCVPTAVVLRRRWTRFPPGPEQLVGACLLCLGYRMLFETDPMAYYYGPMSALLLLLAVASSARHQRLLALTGFALIEVLLAPQSSYLPHLAVPIAVAMEAVCLACCAFGWSLTKRLPVVAPDPPPLLPTGRHGSLTPVR